MTIREILVTGGKGQLGTELGRHAWPEGWAPVLTDLDELDLTDTKAIADMVASRPWAAIISGGAYTAVDKAEEDVVTAWAVNALAPAALATAAAKARIPIVHVSTDYVFDGGREGPWIENDPVAPLGVYGASKEGGEQAVRTANPRHAIVRTAWVVSAHGNNFIKTMLRVGAARPELGVVADQHGSPTSAADLAAAVAQIAIRLADDADAPTGTFHFANAGATTWHGFATAIFEEAAARGGPSPKVNAITTADYPTPAQRPANSLLDCTKIAAAYGITPRPWRAALVDIIDELMGRT